MVDIIFGRDGKARHIHSDASVAITRQVGSISLRRASHVEPTAVLSQAAVEKLRAQYPTLPEGWWADMSPMAGPVLGPYDTKQAALDAEQVWLLQHDLKPA